MNPPADLPPPALSPAAKLSLLLLASFTLLLSFRLWPEWRHNPDLTHGLFMPLLFALMLFESRTSGFRRYLPPGPFRTLLLAASIGLALSALAGAGLYAAALGWSHPLVEFLLTSSLVFFLLAGLVVFSSDSLRLIPFNWNSLAAIGLWLICTPLPPGTYTRLTLVLQLWVSENVLRILHLLGIAAFRTGNIIELARGSVGVEDACSGVRSLLSCLFAGIFFSATLVRRPSARAWVIAVAAPLALGMNFLRSLALTLLANSGLPLAATWHDATGYAVLALTAALLAALAIKLQRRAVAPAPAPAPLPTPPAPAFSPTSSTSPSLLTLTALLVTGSALLIFFALNTRSSLRRGTSIPDLVALLPTAPPGWKSASPADLQQFSGTLETPFLAQRTYTAPASPVSPPLQITLYLAYWPAGQSTVSRVAAHTPDACWPGSGWLPQPTTSPRVTPLISTHALPAAEYRFFTHAGLSQHVWFWHLFGGAPISYQTPTSARDLLALAWHYGFRRDGDQLFVRVSSNQPWSELAPYPLLQEFFAQLQPLGL